MEARPLKNKIVVTAVSPFTPLGNSGEDIARNLENCKCGFQYVSRFNTEFFEVKHAGEVDASDLDSIQYPYDGSLQFKMFYYCMEKLFESLKHNYKSERIGCIIGADPNIGAMEDYEKSFIDFYQNSDKEGKDEKENLMKIDPSMLGYYVAKDFGINGPFVYNLGTCAASTQAIGTGYYMLQDNTADMMIVGGVSSKIDPLSFARLSRLGALEKTHEDLNNNCCPFDKKRSGFTIAEGCVLFALEREEDALKRNANILAEVKGYGAAIDSYSMTNPHKDALGMRLAMERALEDANVDPAEVDYINAHGTGTAVNDVYETKAIKDVFHESAKSVSISSTKSMHGHLITATGAMEMLCCMLAIRDSKIAPTIHHTELDPECDLDYTFNEMKEKEVNITLNNTFGLGGQNASLIISKYEK